MRTLNLVNEKNSLIKYKPLNFPDGQQNIVILSNWAADQPIIIQSRLNNWKDLELISCAVASLREMEAKEIHLFVPYIVGARSDRKFEEGGNNYLKSVICPALNSLNLDSIVCLDPHSDCLEMGLNKFRKISNKYFVNWSYEQIYGDLKTGFKSSMIISPDSGASKKIYKVSEQIGYEGDIITCMKARDTEGKLNKVIVPIDNNFIKLENKDYLIIDDICDGGATFINIATILKERLLKYKLESKIYLIVTHGIFSKGFEELNRYFDGIYCTNSYRDTSNYCLIPDFVKQLNVF